MATLEAFLFGVATCAEDFMVKRVESYEISGANFCKEVVSSEVCTGTSFIGQSTSQSQTPCTFH